ncbi:MAG: hypothetical protein FJ280_22940 [Planctomycetes bacterium]|nr:hypothetical protein [Planctomycetota bacterium]
MSQKNRTWRLGSAALVAALLWLGGCGGPTSVRSLRQSPHRTYTFEVPADAETVYVRIARRAQEKYRFTNRLTYQPGVTTRLAPDAESATVTFWNAGGRGLRYLLTADLHALDPARTEVSLYAASRPAAQEALLWHEWAHTPLEGDPEPPPPQD